MSLNSSSNTDHVRGVSKHTRRAVEPTDESQTFNKAEHVVGRPPVIDESANDTYLRSPPHNLDPSLSLDKQARGLKEGVREESPLAQGVLGRQEIGRMKKDEVESRMLNEEEPF
ncbi:hypothetical protein DENSPDRAFT_835609 [Dentipellis sp. KUC8613]|nr:hypothetical protein DENSPDRAFT_835609 [Dentipellis sp. KUC8613]